MTKNKLTPAEKSNLKEIKKGKSQLDDVGKKRKEDRLRYEVEQARKSFDEEKKHFAEKRKKEGAAAIFSWEMNELHAKKDTLLKRQNRLRTFLGHSKGKGKLK